MKKRLSKALACILTALLVATMMPLQAFADNQYVDPDLRIEFDRNAKATEQDGLLFLDNGFIRVGLTPDGAEIFTIPSNHKGQEESYYYAFNRQAIQFYYYGYKDGGVRHTIPVPSPEAKASRTNDAITMEYTFPSLSADYKMTLTYRLAKMPDTGDHLNNYGAHVSYTEEGYMPLPDYPPVGYLVDGGIGFSLAYFNFDRMGHINASNQNIPIQAVNRFVDDGSTSITTIANPLGLTYAHGSNSSISEVASNNFKSANPFVALTTFDGRSNSLGDDPYYRYANRFEYINLASGSTNPLMALVTYNDYGDGNAFWGYRDLVASGQEAPDDVVIPYPASGNDRLAIYWNGNGYAAVPARGEAGLQDSTARYGSPLAVFYGIVQEINGNYQFVGNVARLSPTVVATWDQNGSLTVSPDGTINQVGVNLNAPSFKFYLPNNATSLKLAMSSDGLVAHMTPSANRAIINIDIPDATVQVYDAVIDTVGNLTFNGNLSIGTVFEDALFSMEKLGFGLNSMDVFTVNGVKASMHYDSAKLYGMDLAKVEGEIDTFPGSANVFDFSLELNVFDLFEAEAELKLKRHTASGVILPDTLYAYFGAEPGIPLVSPVVVARLTGGGAGFSGLAETINGTFIAVPPLSIRGTAGINLLHFVEGKVDITLMAGGYGAKIEDVKLAGSDITIITELSTSAGMQGKTIAYGGDSYTGLQLNKGLGMKANFPSKEEDWISVEGSLGFGAFAGLNSYTAPTKAYILIGGTGNIGGSLRFPTTWWLVGGKVILSASIGAAVSAQTVIPTDGGWTGAIQGISDNAKIAFGVYSEASIAGSQVRVWFGIPLNGDHVYGYDFRFLSLYPLEEWQWGTVNINLPFSTTAVAEDAVGEQVEALSAEAELQEQTTAAGNGVIMPLATSAEVTFDGKDTTDEQSLYICIQTGIDPNNTAAVVDFMDSLKVTDKDDPNNTPLPLNWLEKLGDETSEAELAATNAMLGIDPDSGKLAVLVTVGKGGVDKEFTVEANSDITASTAAGDAPVSYTATADATGYEISGEVKNAETDTTYVVETYLGTEKGATDYLMDRTEVDSITPTSTYTIPERGTAVPSGEYFVTSCLHQKQGKDSDGNGVLDDTEVFYLPLESVEFATAITYTNELQPGAPAFVTANAIGNETMRASWGEVAGAAGYKLTVYSAEAPQPLVDTGITYNINPKDANAVNGITYSNGTYSIDMALTSGGVDEAGNPLGLEAGKSYAIGVQAYIQLDEAPKADGPLSSTPIYSSETRSASEFLPHYIELDPEISLDGSAITADPLTSIYTLTVKSGTESRISVQDARYGDAVFSITREDTGAELTEDNGAFLIPTDFEGTLMLEVTGSYEHDGVTDATSRFILLQHDSMASIITLDSDVFYADPITGKYTVTGITDPGALVESADVITDPDMRTTASAVAGADGAFSMEGYLPTTYGTDDYMNGFVSAVLAFTATDAAGNVSLPVTALATSPIAVKSITVTSEGGATSIHAKGGTLQLYASILPIDASNKGVTWSIVSGAEYATIDQNGLVTAKGNGTVVIRATAQDGSGVYGEFTLTVKYDDASPTPVARTGDAPIVPLLAVLGGAALIGVALLILARRRRS